MTYNQLKVCVTIPQTGSFRTASSKLYLNQPAVRIALNKLEDYLGLSLFSREQYRPTLTPEGKLFYRNAQRVLNQTDSL